MQIKRKKLSELKPNEYNPRKLTEKQERDLEESIKRFGLVDPLIINTYKGRENVIVGGHQRYFIAKKLGIKEVPVVEVNLPLDKEQELNLRLNKNQGEWDWELLANLDKNLLLDVGFDSEEIDLNFGLEVEEDYFDAEKGVEQIVEPTTKPGDVFKLGNHRLMCGDATRREDVEKLMAGGGWKISIY